MEKQIKSGIWQYTEYLPSISPAFRLSLGNGKTSLKRVEGILFKCEYENPTGSVKERGVSYQISYHFSKGIKQAVISSSGNAAISAANYCQLAGIHLTVFVSININKNKLATLEKLDCQIVKTKKPISAAFQYAKKNNATNLRQSQDPVGQIGYETIAYESDKQEPNIDAIFIPVSSGTTLVGIADGLQKLGKQWSIHAVQTEAIHPIASLFDKEFNPQKQSLADALVAKYTPREDQIIEAIKKSKGFGWVISDEEIKKADGWLKSHGIDCSYEGAAALAAFWKAKNHGYRYKKPVCLLTGKKY